MNLDAQLLEILVCPACRATLAVDDAAEELVCNGCGLAYPVRDGIPVMLVDEARAPARGPDDGAHDDGAHDDGAHDDGAHDGTDGPGADDSTPS